MSLIGVSQIGPKLLEYPFKVSQSDKQVQGPCPVIGKVRNGAIGRGNRDGREWKTDTW